MTSHEFSDKYYHLYGFDSILSGEDLKILHYILRTWFGLTFHGAGDITGESKQTVRNHCQSVLDSRALRREANYRWREINVRDISKDGTGQTSHN